MMTLCAGQSTVQSKTVQYCICWEMNTVVCLFSWLPKACQMEAKDSSLALPAKDCHRAVFFLGTCLSLPSSLARL